MNHIEIGKMQQDVDISVQPRAEHFLIVAKSQRKLMRKQSAGKVQVLLQLTVYNMMQQ